MARLTIVRQKGFTVVEFVVTVLTLLMINSFLAVPVLNLFKDLFLPR
jgi:hypothetical protein